jgi:hypothetical protein
MFESSVVKPMINKTGHVEYGIFFLNMVFISVDILCENSISTMPVSRGKVGFSAVLHFVIIYTIRRYNYYHALALCS